MIPCYSSPMIDISHEYRKRPRAFIGAGIIALSFVAALAITHTANRSVEVWALRSAQPAGVRLEPAMLEKVEVYLPESLARYLPASDSPMNKILNVGVGAGELIPRLGVGINAQSAYRREVPIKVGKIDLPPNLQGNDLVDLYLIPSSTNGATTTSTAIARSIRVIAVDNRSRELGGDVGVLFDMDEREIAAFLSSYSGGRIVVVRHGR